MMKRGVKYNCLADKHPDLLCEWNYEKNDAEGVFPDRVSSGSAMKEWWKCQKCGNEWLAPISKRTSGRICPKCSKEHGKEMWSQTCAKRNSLAKRDPESLVKWDYEKNNSLGIFPDKVPVNSEKEVWWKCPVCNHSWQTKVKYRNMCPKCNTRGTSYPEQAIYFYISKIFPDAVTRDQHIGKELDIYIPSIKTAIEYDGSRWHKGKQKLDIDNNKDELCKKKGIRLIRFRDPSLPKTINAEIIKCIDYHYDGLEDGIKKLLPLLKVCDEMPEVDLKRDYDEINAQIKSVLSHNSLAEQYPEIAKEWHPTKNKDLLPEHVMPGTIRSFWWLCPVCGYEWKTSANNRALHGSKCPICYGKRITLAGVNDFKSWCQNNNKELLDEWDYSKNESIGLFPTKIKQNSHKKAYWKCKQCGNEWEAVISSRTRGCGCPKCGDDKRAQYRKKAVINVDTGMRFDGIVSAGEYYKFSKGVIGKIGSVCRGERKTAGGYHWRFDEDN